jgi:hypothetical protein
MENAHRYRAKTPVIAVTLEQLAGDLEQLPGLSQDLGQPKPAAPSRKLLEKPNSQNPVTFAEGMRAASSKTQAREIGDRLSRYNMSSAKFLVVIEEALLRRPPKIGREDFENQFLTALNQGLQLLLPATSTAWEKSRVGLSVAELLRNRWVAGLSLDVRFLQAMPKLNERVAALELSDAQLAEDGRDDAQAQLRMSLTNAHGQLQAAIDEFPFWLNQAKHRHQLADRLFDHALQLATQLHHADNALLSPETRTQLLQNALANVVRLVVAEYRHEGQAVRQHIATLAPEQRQDVRKGLAALVEASLLAIERRSAEHVAMLETRLDATWKNIVSAQQRTLNHEKEAPCTVHRP